jgi:hypothetical protein
MSSVARKALVRWAREGYQPSADWLLVTIANANEKPVIRVLEDCEFGAEYEVTCPTLQVEVLSYRYRDTGNKDIISKFLAKESK